MFMGQRKFELFWLWILAYEMLGAPFAWHKFREGLQITFVGFVIDYAAAKVGLCKRRGDWLVAWIEKVKGDNFVVQCHKFAEFLGRLGFVAQVLFSLKPHLAPL